jgi:hypothetical protein
MSIVRRAAFVAAAITALTVVAAVPVDAGVPPTTGIQTATLTISKVVQGEAPAGAEFVIEVDCVVEGVTELTFPAEGGSQELVFFEEDSCTVTETQTGGAVDVTPPVTIAIAEPILYEVTITNVFDTAPSSETTASTQADTAVRPTFTG